MKLFTSLIFFLTTAIVGVAQVLWAAGYNVNGQLGDGTGTNRLTPVQVASGVAAVAAGQTHSLFLKTDGTLWGMGNNGNGQLGDGTTTQRTTPVQVASGVAAMAAGENHSLFLKTDGTLWAAGYNYYGQLGNGTTTDRSTPVQVASGVSAVSAGDAYSLYVKTDGTLWAMGLNNYSQLGDGTTTNRSTPVQVASGVAAVADGGSHSLYLKTDGTLWATGRNNTGQLGDGTTTNRTTPVQVASGVAAVSAGGNHSLHLKTDGTLWAMGENVNGQLGDGTTTSRTTPVQVASGVAAVSAGVYHSLYLKTDGTLWAAGYNYYGQLGNGTTTDRSTPVQVASGVAAVAAGGNHSLIIFVPAAPTIIVQPQSQTATLTQSVYPLPPVHFDVVASSNLKPTYQWQKDGVTIPNATSPTLLIYVNYVTDAGGYSVIVTNPVNLSTVTSSVATLTVISSPRITTQPNYSQTVTAGSSVTFSVVATGTPTLTYQWRKGGVTIDGATNATYTIASAAVSNAGDYYVAVRNEIGSVTSAPARLTVNEAPAITTQPSSQTVPVGNSVTFSVVATGTPTPTYQWRKDGVAIAGATQTSLTLANLGLADGGSYSVVVTNAASSVTSNAALLALYFPIAASVNIIAGKDFCIFATTGPSSGSIQWQLSTDAGSSWSDLSNGDKYTGATSNILKILQATNATSNYRYRYQITTSGKTYTSEQTTSLAVIKSPFLMPTAIKFDLRGNLYVADSAAHALLKVTPDYRSSVLAGAYGVQGSSDGIGLAAKFNEPTGIFYRSDLDTITLADTSNNVIRSISASGNVTTLAGAAGIAAYVDGAGSVARFNAPTGIDADSSGIYVVTDQSNHLVRLVTVGGTVATLAGKAGIAGSVDSLGESARFNLPTGITFNRSGKGQYPNHIFVTDTGSHTIRVIGMNAQVTTFAGKSGIAGAENGYGANARFNQPRAVIINGEGDIFIADTANHTIRKHSVSTGLFTTFAGTPTVKGLMDGTGSSTLFNEPESLAFDAAGNLYVADTGNAAIRKITPAGVVTTLPIVGEIPTITTQPTSLTVTAGNAASLSVVATGYGTLTYQWKKDGSDIAGATGATYTISSTATTSAGIYSVVVTNAAGSVTSATATLTVNVLPAITTQPSSQSVTVGSSVTFSVVATGTPTPTYQWRKDGAAISGSTATSYALSSPVSGDAGSYTVVVTNAAGSVTSSSATLTVNAAYVPPPPSSGGGGGGGGGAVSSWFIGALGLLLLARRVRRLS